MEEFVIDKVGTNLDDDVNEIDADDDDDFNHSLFKSLPDIDDTIENVKTFNKNKSNQLSLNNTYLISSYKNREKDHLQTSSVKDLLKKSVIKPGFEKKKSLDIIKSNRASKIERKKLRERTRGQRWFDIPATEVTDEIKNDFEILKMRSVLDRKHVYKNNSYTSAPKYFQVGKVLDSPADFYSGRIVKSQRKKTMVEELLADAECKHFQKKKYKEIMDAKRWKKGKKKNTQENNIKKEKKKGKHKK